MEKNSVSDTVHWNETEKIDPEIIFRSHIQYNSVNIAVIRMKGILTVKKFENI